MELLKRCRYFKLALTIGLFFLVSLTGLENSASAEEPAKTGDAEPTKTEPSKTDPDSEPTPPPTAEVSHLLNILSTLTTTVASTAGSLRTAPATAGNVNKLLTNLDLQQVQLNSLKSSLGDIDALISNLPAETDPNELARLRGIRDAIRKSLGRTAADLLAAKGRLANVPANDTKVPNKNKNKNNDNEEVVARNNENKGQNKNQDKGAQQNADKNANNDQNKGQQAQETAKAPAAQQQTQQANAGKAPSSSSNSSKAASKSGGTPSGGQTASNSKKSDGDNGKGITPGEVPSVELTSQIPAVGTIAEFLLTKGMEAIGTVASGGTLNVITGENYAYAPNAKIPTVGTQTLGQNYASGSPRSGGQQVVAANQPTSLRAVRSTGRLMGNLYGPPSQSVGRLLTNLTDPVSDGGRRSIRRGRRVVGASASHRSIIGGSSVELRNRLVQMEKLFRPQQSFEAPKPKPVPKEAIVPGTESKRRKMRGHSR